MTIEHVEAVATKRAVVIPALITTHRHEFGEPLPSSFQLSDIGRIVRVRMSDEVGGGTGAGGGVASGPVTYDTENPPAGSVLVTTTLQPGLAPLLPRLKGMVAETGSVLSHLAILAREAARRDRRRLRGSDGRPPRGSDRARRRRDRASRRPGGGSPMKIIAWVAGLATLVMGAGVHDRLAQPVGVEPGAVLRPHRPHRGDRPRDRARAPTTHAHGVLAHGRPRRSPTHSATRGRRHRTGSPGSSDPSSRTTSSSRSSSVAVC